MLSLGTKPQGKWNPEIVARGLLDGKKKYKIAEEAGSLSKNMSTKIALVNRIAKSSKVQAILRAAAPKAASRVEQLCDQDDNLPVALGAAKDILDRTGFQPPEMPKLNIQGDINFTWITN